MLFVFTMTLQGQNKLLSSLDEQYYNGTWNNSSGTNYEYDSNNNLITETGIDWNTTNNAWEIKTKTSYTYNANNKVTEEIYKSSWDSPTNTLENSYKETYSYTGGRVTEAVYYEWASSNWLIDGKTVITYNTNNLPSGYLWYEWDGTQWVNEERVMLSYNANNKLISEVTEEWIGLQWVNSYKTLYTYNANNKMITYESAEWDKFNSIWVANSYKTEYVWDATGNKTRETEYYEYEGNSYQYKDEYTYDTFNLISNFAHPFKDKTGLDYIFEDVPHINKVQGYNSYSYNQSTNSYDLSSSRTTYNYNSSIVLATEKFETASATITVFPNPTQDFLTIQTSLNTDIDKVIVTDLSGKIVLQQNSKGNNLNVQNLTKGMFLIQISSGDKQHKTKFLKE